MSEKTDVKAEGAASAGAEGDARAGAGAATERGARADAGPSADRELLANALRFERAKNKVLLDELVALEDEVVNRCMADFEAVVSEETREFWREQLLTNRDIATAALTELARCKGGSGFGVQGAGGKEPISGEGAVARERIGRRPLHNRAMVRTGPSRDFAGQPVAGAGSAAAGSGVADVQAARIRNRAHEISRGERIPFSAAFRRAERELAEG